jgi:PhzF family phenazine biosynthesis protein
MKTFPFKKMDAFSRGTSSGNPAGCIYLENTAAIDEMGMQKIARELKGFVNEVGYLFPVADGFRLKFYSSECEVEFCGHATIAIMYDLIHENRELMEKNELSLYVNAGKLSVFNEIGDEDAVYIMAPAPHFLSHGLTVADTARALAIDENKVDGNQPIQVVNAGLRTLIVPLVSLNACLEAYPPQEQLRLFCEANDIDIVLVFTGETHLETSQYRTRVFAPKYGYLEDPATGSGNAAFGHYLLHRGLWAGNVTIEQGPSRETPNIVKLRRYQKEQEERILFGGSSVLRICGNYLLHG